MGEVTFIQLGGDGRPKSLGLREGMTVEDVLHEFGITSGEVRLKVNGEVADESQDLSPGDRVTATPTNLKVA